MKRDAPALALSVRRHVDQYISVFDPNIEPGHGYVLIEMVLPGAAIVAAAMPGTHEQILLQHALSERSTAAWTLPIKRMHFTFEIADGVVFALNVDLGGRAWWQI